MVPLDGKIIIVGAGVFGSSSAYHLLKIGYKNVTVLDRASVLPAEDAASTDLNKIIRTSYSDIFYTKLAQESITAWKDTDFWGSDTPYHESGVLVLNSPSKNGVQTSYADVAYENDIAIGATLENVESHGGFRKFFPEVPIGLEGRTGFFNHNGGWGHSAKAVSIMISKVTELGGKVLPSKGVKHLVRQEGKTTGVQCTDGSTFPADLVILAVGSWTASTFREFNLAEDCVATGQSLATIQLSQEEGDLYRACPVVLDFDSGFYIFPPNKDNVVKLAIHAAGYTNTQEQISTPRTSTSHVTNGLSIPRVLVKELRSRLQEIYPGLAEKPFSGTRMCWYSDSPNEDWVIGRHPSDSSVLFATGDSGHAFKFLPVIGKLVAIQVQDKMDPLLANKFRLGRKQKEGKSSRVYSKIAELDVNDLCTSEDLLP